MSFFVGLTACGISAFLFGSMFVPVRSFDSGDGIFAQWIMSIAILLVGFVVFLWRSLPGFYPLAMLGGAFWTMGNALAIPIINRVGMALGMLIWNIANCLTGWASGRFGLFGTIARPPANSALNYAGLACVLIGGILFSRLESIPREKKSKKMSVKMSELGEIPEKEALNGEQPTETTDDSDGDVVKLDEVKVQAPKVGQKDRALSFALSTISGILYGLTFAPVNYMIDNPTIFKNYPSAGLDYVFSHYFGIFVTATAIFVVYAFAKKNRPSINPELALPSLLSGLFWGTAQSSFFVANDNLSQAVTFPIITMLPGCVASAWSILYLKEIRGQRNYILLAVAMTITLFGAAMVGLSKDFSL